MLKGEMTMRELYWVVKTGSACVFGLAGHAKEVLSIFQLTGDIISKPTQHSSSQLNGEQNWNGCNI